MTVASSGSGAAAQPLHGKRILLGIGGGIAAYKAADLVRRLKERGAAVRVILTAGGAEFITPLTLQALSGEPVGQSMLDPQAEAAMGHIELARWADLILVAPATADLIAKIAHGLAGDLLTTCILASSAPLAVAPAMNQQMYKNIATQANLATLKSRNIHIIGPASGEQACGDVGLGRMMEPIAIAEYMVEHTATMFTSAATQAQTSAATPQDLAGLSVLLTAGPTREAIDPVRFISNHSSGKMGYALASAAAARGAKVTLVSGPVELATPAGVQRISVQSADDMYAAVMQHAAAHDIFIGCAAVADYKVAQVAAQKLKKQQGQSSLSLQLVQNPDIIAAVAALSQQRPFTVGFAAETQQVAQYAKDKLQRKNLDLICANDVSNSNIGFHSDQNAMTLFWPGGERGLPLADKHQIAHQIFDTIKERLHEQHSTQNS